MGQGKPEDILLIEPAIGEVRRFAELWQWLAHARPPGRSCCRHTRLWDFARGFVPAVVAGGDIELVDGAGQESGDVPDVQTIFPQLVGALGEPVTSTGRLAELITASASRITLRTSGSTGSPKAVRHTLGNLCRGVRMGPRYSADVWGFAYNPLHIAGVQVFLQAIMNGNPMVRLFGLGGAAVLDAMEAHQVTHLSATPSFYRMLLPTRAVLPWVRMIALGGERVDSALLERLRPVFPQARIRNLYGSTEAGALLASEGEGFRIPAELTSRVVVRDGHLWVHRSLLGDFLEGDCEGDWYDTGDRVEADPAGDGGFKLVARDRECLNVGGNKVLPGEVERVLLAHPGVREARVFGRPSSVLGMLLCAEYVSVQGEIPEGDLRRHLGAHLPAHKVPRIIQSVVDLRMTPTGKLQRVDRLG